MAPGIIIITAHGVEASLVNRLLLHLRDWEYRADDLANTDSFLVLMSKNDLFDKRDDEYTSRPPILKFIDNEWEGLSFEEVERIMIQNDNGHGSLSLFLLLDDKGVEEQTIILAHRAGNDPAADKFKFIDEFNKMRIPWEKAYISWVNLDIGNMDFGELCKEGEANNRVDFEGDWRTFSDCMSEGHYEPFRMQAEQAFEGLQKGDPN